MILHDRFASVDGLRLHYREWGDRSRPHLLLVHGWDGTARYWDLVAPAFQDRFHLVAVTLRGRGLSDPDPTGDYRFEGYVDELRAFSRRLGLERLSWLGASLGGMIGLPYVARYPDQVDRLALIDIGAQLGGDRPSSYYAGMLDAPDRFTSLGEAEAWLRQWTLYTRLPASGMAIVLQEHLEQAPDASWRWRYMDRLRAAQRRVPRDVLFPSQWAVLPRVDCPVLIVHGTRSESLLPDVAERTRAALPRATLARIPDCSHFPFLEAPEVLIALLGPFLEGPGEPSEPESDLRRST
jgi:pimeloyl-ACP methyl ester carboxylesterase